MAIVIKDELVGWKVVMGGHCLGVFGALLDAHCFALQLMERGMADSVQLYSGITVK